MYPYQRRHERVEFRGMDQLGSRYGVGIDSPEGQLKLRDLSLSGAAMTSKENHQVGDSLSLKFQLSGAEFVELDSKVVRVDEDRVAVEFEHPPIDAQMAIDRILRNRIIGQNMRLVNPQLYNKDSGYTFWFNGDHDCHLFVWETSAHRMARFEFELRGQHIEYNGEFKLRQAHESLFPNFDDGGTLESRSFGDHPVNENWESTPLLQQAFEVISQIKSHREILDPITQTLLVQLNNISDN